MAAHLIGDDGTAVGVQFSLIRIGLVPPNGQAAASAWEARELYRGHVIVSDEAGGATFGEERFGRGLAGVAGYNEDQRELRLDDWSLTFETDGGTWHLRAGVGTTYLALELTPEKAPTTADIAEAPFRGYAVTRFQVEGRIETPEGELPVAGAAWFDHLWGDLPLPGGSPVASDRLQLHLDDGSEVSVVRSRRLDGGGTPTVDGFLVGAEGSAEAVAAEAGQVELTRRWQGAAAAWPVDWSVQLGDLELQVTPVVDDQEHAFAAAIWSGLVRAEGRRGDRPVRGFGTLQLTGYGN